VRGKIQAVAIVTKRFKPFKLGDKTVHQIGLPWHWGFKGLCVGDSANNLSPHVGDANTMMAEGGIQIMQVVGHRIGQRDWIISGLIILNSRLVDEGDVIELHDGEKIMSVVFKTKIFHTELLNLVNNHRVMIQNARLRGMTIANLSRFASARGLRENLRFKVGYDVSEAQIEELFKNVFERANKEQEIPMEYQYPLQVAVMNTGDFAVEWGVYYYLKEVKKLLPVRQQLLALTLQESSKLNISLATPLRYVAENEVTDKP